MYFHVLGKIEFASLFCWPTDVEAALRTGLTSRLKGTSNPVLEATRWTTILSSKVNVHHAIDFRALLGADLVTKNS